MKTQSITRAGQWGNSVGVRLSDAIAEEMGIHAGTPIRIRRVRGGLFIEKQQEKLSLKELVDQITPETRHDFMWDDLEPIGREIW